MTLKVKIIIIIIVLSVLFKVNKHLLDNFLTEITPLHRHPNDIRVQILAYFVGPNTS